LQSESKVSKKISLQVFCMT